MNPSRITKALIGALIAGLGVLSVSYTSGNHISTPEWIGAAIVALTALGGVFAVQNTLYPQDVPVSTLVNGAALQGMELAPIGSVFAASIPRPTDEEILKYLISTSHANAATVPNP